MAQAQARISALGRPRRTAAVHPAGYYRSLHLSSSVDGEDPCCSYGAPRQLRSLRLTDSDSLPQGVYSVDRVVALRKKSCTNQYLVIWEGYPNEEASWVASEDLTETAIRSFEDPQPAYRLVADHASTLIDGIQKSLRAGVITGYKFSIEFRTDVFKFLFGCKGRDPVSGRGRIYDIDAFDPLYFPKDWYKVYDKLGNGCTVDFPIRLESKLKWSPVMYDKLDDATLKAKCKHFTEVLFVTLVKNRCM